ncbi:MAG: DNA-3-methyladenine glycosylase 2 family protein [Bacteroidetes bacterium]|nr:DNA-3-methyladenine glycosylase 2 family protein [Bacteroidota bacterium]
MAGKDSQILHLKKDKKLKKVIEQVGVLKTKKNEDLFISLLSAIVSQQLSVKAANTIWGRFEGLFKDRIPTAKAILKLKDDKLRSVGLSYQKAGYLKNISNFSLEQTLDYKLLKTKTDDELVEYLVQIKGVGRWTVEMLLMFNLNRKDVFPKDDLGIQNGMKKLYGLTTEKKALLKEMEEIAESWRPYRTAACMYIWRYKDTQ